MMAVSTLLKSCATPPASWPIACIFWLWARFSCSVRCSVVSRAKTIALAPSSLSGSAAETNRRAERAALRALERNVERRDFAPALGGRGDRLAQGGVVALRHEGEDGQLSAARGRLQRLGDETGEGGVWPQERARGVDRGDRDRRRVEEARETHLCRAQVFLALEFAWRAVDDQRSGRTRRAVAGKGDLVEYPGRQDPALPGLQIDVELLGLHLAWLAGHHRQHGAAVARDDVVDLELAEPELGKVEIEPFRKRRVHINDRAVAIGREEPGGSMVEIVDRMLEILKEAFVAVMLARLVGHRPDRRPRLWRRLRAAARECGTRRRPLAVQRRGEAQFLARALARLGRLRQPVDGLGDVRRPGEQALDRLQFAARTRARQRAIGFVGVKNARFAVGDHDAVRVGVDDRLGCVEAGRPDRELQQAEGKEQQDPTRRKRRARQSSWSRSPCRRRSERATARGSRQPTASARTARTSGFPVRSMRSTKGGGGVEFIRGPDSRNPCFASAPSRSPCGLC